MDDVRMQSVLESMRRAGLDVLIAVSGEVHAFQRLDPVVLLSGLHCVGDSYVLLRQDGESELVVSPPYEAERARAHSRTTSCRGCADLVESLIPLITMSGPGPAIGIVGLDGLSFGVATRLKAAAQRDLRRFDAEFVAATRRKTAAEIADAWQATRIAEQGYELLLQLATPGMREIDLATEINTAMLALGADDNFLMLSASQHNRAVRPPGSHILELGDVILCEVSPSYRGQFTQICRTIYVGVAPPPFTSKYALLQESLRRGIAATVPGARVADVVAAINANLIEAGYGEYCVPPHMRARGHGLGFGSIAPGDLGAQSAAVIEQDMVFVIHPNQYIPETGYMMCGDPVVVTATGAHNLASRPAVLDEVPRA